MATAVAPLRGRFIRSASAGTGHAAGPRTRTVRIDDPDPGLLEKTMTRPAPAPAACCPRRSVRHALRRRGRHAPHDARRARAAPLKIGYSDWPGWVAFQVALDKGWFKEAGVDVDFEWFDYSASLDAFSAGKLDAVAATNGDALVTKPAGAKNVMILLTDYSAGNDMIVAKPPLRSVEALKGKKVGVELGLVDHLLLETALQKHGLKDGDVTLVNAKTNELPQVLGSSTDIAAVAAWQPNAGER